MGTSVNECADARRHLAAPEGAALAFAEAQASNFRLLEKQSAMLSLILRSQDAFKETVLLPCAALSEPDGMKALRARRADAARSNVGGLESATSELL